MLPKFEVAIESPDHFTFNDEIAKIIVRAKYTHGKPLRGTAVVSVFDANNYGFFMHRSDQSNTALAMKTVIVDGGEIVEFDLNHDLKLDRSKWYRDGCIQFKVDFTETLTGLTQSTEKSVTIFKNAYVITTNLENKSFKPNTKIDVTVCIVYTSTFHFVNTTILKMIFVFLLVCLTMVNFRYR